VIFGTGGGGGGTATVAVQDVTGQLASEAATSLKSQGFEPKKGVASNGPCTGNQTVEKDHVCVTEPAAGMKIDKGSVVTYRLFTPRQVTVPFVEGKSYGDAVEILRKAQLQAKKDPTFSTETKDKVLSQDPAQFTTAKPGDEVILKVSTGTIKLPDVIGDSIQNARAKLDGAQFLNRDERTKTTGIPSRNGKVADESPTPKIAYPVSQKITLTVYKYVAPPPTCTTPPPSPTSPPPTGPTIPSIPGSTPTGSTSTGLPPCR
jgi:beta-lactam-binding protein with PASTA domain